MSNKLDEMMTELSFRDNHAGTEYVRLAAAMYDRSLSMTKELYPAIAKVAGTTPAAVERNIRSAIASAFERSSWTAQEKYFGSQDRIPTNGEFIARAARFAHDD